MKPINNFANVLRGEEELGDYFMPKPVYDEAQEGRKNEVARDWCAGDGEEL